MDYIYICINEKGVKIVTLTYKRRSVKEWKSLTLFGIHLNLANTSIGKSCWGESSGRSGKESGTNS